MIVNIRSLAVTLLVAVMGLGCAANPSTYEDESRNVALDRYDSVQVVVEAAPHIRQLRGYDLTSGALMREFTEHVRETGRFHAVGADVAGERPLEVRLSITQLNYVHGAVKFLGGVLSKTAVLAVTMNVKDKTTGEVVRTVSLHAGGERMHGIFGATTGRQVSAMAKQLAAAL